MLSSVEHVLQVRGGWGMQWVGWTGCILCYREPPPPSTLP